MKHLSGSFVSFCRNAAVGVSIAVVSLGVAAQGAISAIAASIQHKYGIPVIPHILCGGFSKSETEHVLID